MNVWRTESSVLKPHVCECVGGGVGGAVSFGTDDSGAEVLT